MDWRAAGGVLIVGLLLAPGSVTAREDRAPIYVYVEALTPNGAKAGWDNSRLPALSVSVVTSEGRACRPDAGPSAYSCTQVVLVRRPDVFSVELRNAGQDGRTLGFMFIDTNIKQAGIDYSADRLILGEARVLNYRRSGAGGLARETVTLGFATLNGGQVYTDNYVVTAH